ISYNYGAQNHSELKNVIKKSFIILIVVSILMLIASILLAKPLSLVFLSSSSDALELSTLFLMIYSISFPLTAICIFLTAMFTSLNNGLISGLIALFRTLIFSIACALLLPLIFNSGYALCWANLVAEVFSIILSLVFYFSNKKKYHY
ncbi:MAG: MATE family efflux transporter, partial [Bacilli bacterium]|nr:MATE family efflux transporter [Bacilli bacterium]